MVTTKDLANALREAEKLVIEGKLERVGDTWVDCSAEPVCACAAGGIALVLGMDTRNMRSWTLREAYPVFARNVADSLDILNIVSTKNSNGESWSSIADWLEGLGAAE